MLVTAAALLVSPPSASAYTGPERLLAVTPARWVLLDPTPNPSLVADGTFTDFGGAGVACGRSHLLLLAGPGGAPGGLTWLDPVTGAVAASVDVAPGTPLTAALQRGSRTWVGGVGGPIRVIESGAPPVSVDVSGLVQGTPVVGALVADGPWVYAVVGGMSAGRPLEGALVRIDAATHAVDDVAPLVTRHPLRQEDARPFGVAAAVRGGELVVTGTDWRDGAAHAREVQVERVQLDPFRSLGLAAREGLSEGWLGITLDRRGDPVWMDAQKRAFRLDLDTLQAQSVQVSDSFAVGLIWGDPFAMDSRGHLWTSGWYIQNTFYAGLVDLDLQQGVAAWSWITEEAPTDLVVCRPG